MINVEVKYYNRPMKLNETKTEIIKYTSNYVIDEYKKVEDYYDTPASIMRQEITQIFKRYKGIYSIKFDVGEKEINNDKSWTTKKGFS